MSRDEKAILISRELKKLAQSSTELSINELRIILALERIVGRLTAHKVLGRHILFKGGCNSLDIHEARNSLSKVALRFCESHRYDDSQSLMGKCAAFRDQALF